MSAPKLLTSISFTIILFAVNCGLIYAQEATDAPAEQPAAETTEDTAAPTEAAPAEEAPAEEAPAEETPAEAAPEEAAAVEEKPAEETAAEDGAENADNKEAVDGHCSGADLTKEEEAFEKHDGIYLRLAVGPGFSYFSTSYPNHSFSLMGPSVVPELMAGMTPIENLEVTMGLIGTIMVEPELDFSAYDKSATVDFNHLTALAFAAGVTYYIMPINMFVGTSLGFSYMKLGLNDDGMEVAAESTFLDPAGETRQDTAMAYEAIGRHRLGLAYQAMIGKEWWVGNNSGLGIALDYQLYYYPKSHSDETADQIGASGVSWLGHTASLKITATYN